jgi:tetratricopeptide (TPR) repeat protein
MPRKPRTVEAPRDSPDRLVTFAALIAATLVAYYPAWFGGMLWDDEAHLTAPALRSLGGLWRIWFEPGATQQYYPVVHSVFWLFSHLWGQHTVGYHLVNIALHATSSWLVVMILRRLNVPGALLAGAIFALHPVHVESVAWMTELKNTLSGVLYLSSLFVYLHFDEHRRRADYFIALGLFVLALLSKSVVGTLPAAILVIFWWQRGTLRWREDVVPLLPLFALGIGSGLFTAWVERTYIGAAGAEFQISAVERVLIAGRALWFYVAKLVWPANLMFTYRRWTIDPSAALQWAFPIAAVVVFAGLWLWRRRARGPLAAALFFAGSLFPALGFFNVYPFRYSFVADHFQYLASLGVIAAFSAAITTLIEVRPRRASLRAPQGGRVGVGSHAPLNKVGASELVLMLAIAATLAFLTWRQSHQYTDARTLYAATLEKDPDSWFSHNNLAVEYLRGDPSELPNAVEHIQAAIRLNPNIAEPHNNMGLALQKMKRYAESLVEERIALQLKPSFAGAEYNVGLDYEGLGNLDAAIAAYQRALAIDPNTVEAHNNLANILQRLNRFDEAAAHIQAALRLYPELPDLHQNLGNVYQRQKRWDEAIAEYRAALALRPTFAEVENNLGLALEQVGRGDEAIAAFRDAARNMPDSSRIHHNLAKALWVAGQKDEAVSEFGEAIKADPSVNSAQIRNDLGVVLATLGRVPEAVVQFQEALRVRPDFAEAQTNLARALRMMGR